MATGFQLSDEYEPGGSRDLVLGGIPGVWAHGEALRPEELGYTVDEFRALVADTGAPLVEVTLDPEEGPTIPFSTADVVPLPAAGPVLDDDDPDALSGVPGLTNRELAERDRYDAARRERLLPSGGEIPVTFTEETHTAPPLTDEAVLELRRAALSDLNMADLKTLAPEGVATTGSKADLVDALLAAGVSAPDPDQPGEEG